MNSKFLFLIILDFFLRITRIDFERPSINQKLGQNEYYDSFPTPGSFGRLINNNDFEDNDVTKVFDFRSPTASDVCIIEVCVY